VEQVGSPAFLRIVEMRAHPHRLAAELLDSADGGAVYVARHVVVELEGILYAERALGLKTALVDHRIVEAPLLEKMSFFSQKYQLKSYSWSRTFSFEYRTERCSSKSVDT